MCIFCDIVNKKSPAKILYEDEEVIAFPDINPSLPVHILIIPKKHIPSANEISPADQKTLGKMITVAKNLAKKNQIAEAGYKLIINCGKAAGQIIPHLHLHLLGGGPMTNQTLKKKN